MMLIATPGITRRYYGSDGKLVHGLSLSGRYDGHIAEARCEDVD